MKEKILHFLKDSPEYVSGEEISRRCGMSRAAIWKYMQELRQDGFDVVAVPHLGYKLIASPDKLLPSEIQHGLKTQYLGKKIIYEDTIGSTMDVAFRLGIEGAVEGTVICAEAQTKGKGRLGRQWSSPKGKGIYMSAILRPSLPPTEVAQLTLLAAVAVCEALRRKTGVAARIKWPNDILVENRKLAGILTELSAETDRVRFVVIGVGINVNTPLSLLPPQATSLKEETQQKTSRVELLQEILYELETWYERLKKDGFAPVVARWKELSATLGRRVRLIDPSGEIEGEAVDLDKTGRLMIRNDAGLIVSKISGDVVQVR